MKNFMTGPFFWNLFNRPTTTGEANHLANLINKLHSTRLSPVYDDYLYSGPALARGSSAPDLAELRNGLFLLAFAGTGATTEQGFFTLHILHGIQPNTTPTLHIHWTHNNASPSGNVKWQVDYSIARGYGADTYSTPTTITTTQAAAAQYTHHITNDDDLPISGNIEPDSVMIARVYRDPTDSADTFEDDAFLIHIDMHYLRDRIGSTQRNRPFDGY